MSALPQDIAGDAIEHWRHVAPVLARPRTTAEYEHLVEVLNNILDRGGADESHPLASLAALIGDLMGEYETQHVPESAREQVEVLRFLMEQHGLTQSELPEIGNQSVVSQILSGNRQLNLRQVAALSKRFGVSADAFVD